MDDSKQTKRLLFSVKVGKSYKNRGWAVKRDSATTLIPKLSYEEECDVIIDGIRAKARLNIVPRIFYRKDDEIVGHLKKLYLEGVDRITLEMLLNHEVEEINSIDEIEINNNKILNELSEKDVEIKKLNEDISNFMKLVKDKDSEIAELNKQIENLKKIDNDRNNEMDVLLDSFIQLDLEKDELSKKIIFYKHENAKLNKKIEETFNILHK